MRFIDQKDHLSVCADLDRREAVSAKSHVHSPDLFYLTIQLLLLYINFLNFPCPFPGILSSAQRPFTLFTLHHVLLHIMSIQYILEPIIVAVGKT